ncbi:MAG: DUF2157 domain-containing protein [Cryomorphaceae bacterium]|nr:DUF2157 domain-containing protein [Cryomorphaceae bacterium]
MSKLKIDLSELVQSGIISAEKADQIKTLYQSKSGHSANRLFVVFGLLGAILIGLGIILLIAHNWDQLSKITKTIFTFLPLLVGQVLCGYTLLKASENITWRESSSVFTFFAVGASISLISQIYHIPGELSNYLLTWMLLVLPLTYVMRSSFSSLLYIAGITYYAVEVGYFDYPVKMPSLYWFLLLAILPQVYLIYEKKPLGNFIAFHHWFIPISLGIVLGTVNDQASHLMMLNYMGLFGLFYLFGYQLPGKSLNGYRIIGSLGTIILLLVLSFDDFWGILHVKGFSINETVYTREFLFFLMIFFLYTGIGFFKFKSEKKHHLTAWIFPVFILIFFSGFIFPKAHIFVNIIILFMGIWIIYRGDKENHLGTLNFGLLIIAALVTCRFFDNNIPFYIRGLMFLFVGAGFFMANYRMIKRAKAVEQKIDSLS